MQIKRPEAYACVDIEESPFVDLSNKYKNNQRHYNMRNKRLDDNINNDYCEMLNWPNPGDFKT